MGKCSPVLLSFLVWGEVLCCMYHWMLACAGYSVGSSQSVVHPPWGIRMIVASLGNDDLGFSLRFMKGFDGVYAWIATCV